MKPAVVFACDERYVHPLLVAVVSLVDTGGVNGSNASIRVLHHSLSGGARSRVMRVGDELDVDLEIVPAVSPPAEYPVWGWASDAAYLRFQLDLAADHATTVLYLDCDVVAVGDVTALLSTSEGRGIAAVRDVNNPLVGVGEGLPGYELLGVPTEREYFNSGVMVVDVEHWRRHQIAQRCAEFLAEHREHVRFWDQDALNYVVGEDWYRLPLEYNVPPLSAYMPFLEDHYRGGSVLPLADALALERGARILHFAGPLKPWQRFPDGPALAAYRRFERILADLEGM